MSLRYKRIGSGLSRATDSAGAFFALASAFVDDVCLSAAEGFFFFPLLSVLAMAVCYATVYEYFSLTDIPSVAGFGGDVAVAPVLALLFDVYALA